MYLYLKNFTHVMLLTYMVMLNDMVKYFKDNTYQCYGHALVISLLLCMIKYSAGQGVSDTLLVIGLLAVFLTNVDYCSGIWERCHREVHGIEWPKPPSYESDIYQEEPK